ncbi:MAG: DNA primase [Candidatus Omnitrophota bacterium]
MTGRIPDNLIEDILSRVDIVEVVSGYLPLKRAGRNFKANCPFHHEKTPSFMVSPDRQIYHCFGCGESGNAFKFLMRYERMEFPEAVETLAKKTGVVLPQLKDEDHKTISLGTQLYKINELSASFYADNLDSPEGARAKDYLLKRGLKPQTLKLFKLGVASDKWDGLINYLRTKNIPLSLLEKAGLIVPKESGGYYDRFRNRIIFPIFDIKSRPVGFGARVMDKSLPKYVNSPETPIYTKGKNLYGLHLAKEGIRDTDSVIVVEGYIDFIIPYQEGIRNVVASQGTALTLEQVRLLKRYTHNVVMVYDGDAAGELATLRSLDIFIEEDMNVMVVPLDEGFDPDSYVRKNGIEKFREKIGQAQNLFDYKLDILRSRYNPRQIEGKASIASAILETIDKFKNAVLKSEYIKRLAQVLDIREESLLQELKKVKQDRPYEALENLARKKGQNISPTESLLIKLMLEETELINRIRQSLEPSDFQDARISRIVSIMFDLVEEGKNIVPSVLMNDFFKDEEIAQVLCESMFLPVDSSMEHKERIVDDCVQRIKSERLKLRKMHLHQQINEAQTVGDENQLQRLIKEFDSLIKNR